MNNVAIARHTQKSKQALVTEFEDSNINNIKRYLKQLKGAISVTVEESTASQWLYTELKPCCDNLIICNPYYNRLLSSGPKNDAIDAQKLAYLLRANLLKPVYHSGEELIFLRKIVSGYEDLVKATVRSKNQLSSLNRAFNNTQLDESAEFVAKGLREQIHLFTMERQRYIQKFHQIKQTHKTIQLLEEMPGIGVINAIKLLTAIVDIKRFSNASHFISYCGLIKHEIISGGRSYGRRKVVCNNTLKAVFKTAALTNIVKCQGNAFYRYYEYLISEKNYPEYKARHALARKIAKITYGVLKYERNVNLRNMH